MKKTKFHNPLTGDTLTRYHSPRGSISLCPPTHYTLGKYEITCLKGNLFKGVERFITLGEAETRIKEFLGVKDDQVHPMS